MKILVAIPTWNRANYLDKAIQAIATARSASQGCEVDLFVSDNCSSDHTVEVMARWQEQAPWIHYRRWEEHVAFFGPELFRRALLGSGLTYDYLWLQGDDDAICDIAAYDKLTAAIEACEAHPPCIVHCCQGQRALPGDTRIIEGNTEDLCNTYGWHDLLGWISSLVMSSDTVERMLSSPHSEMQPPSSYWHAEALLEAGYGHSMLILTEGLIVTQDERQTPECVERWAKTNVGPRYWHIIPGLSSLKERGVITKPLTLGFFRYLTYSFWDRFALELLQRACSSKTPAEVIETHLSMLGYMGDLLGYREDAKLYKTWLDGFRSDLQAVRRTHELVLQRMESYQQPSYSFSLLNGDDR